jgi:hypothetical protein
VVAGEVWLPFRTCTSSNGSEIMALLLAFAPGHISQRHDCAVHGVEGIEFCFCFC